MRLLLDTHALLWWLSDDPRLGQPTRMLIADPDNEVLVSVASLWEIVVKLRIGKLEADIGAVDRAIIRSGFDRLPIKQTHLSVLTTLPLHHRDPFDHLLIAQAMVEDAVLVSDDRNVPYYTVRCRGCGDS